MAVLINRNPPGRLICLHALIQTLNMKFPNSQNFANRDAKYDANLPDNHNITCYCTLLEPSRGVRYTTCPYLVNPISDAKCLLTQSIQRDKQNEKAVGVAIGALDGLGLIDGIGRNNALTQLGIKFANCDSTSKEYSRIVQRAVLDYGPFLALLYNAKESRHDIISPSDITLGYPSPNESVKYDGKLQKLSLKSKEDGRTTRALFSWAVTTGFAISSEMIKMDDKELCRIRMEEKVRAKIWNWKLQFVIPKELFDGTHMVNRPLSYDYMTKDPTALRENGKKEKLVREATIMYDPMVKNRRFAIVYALARCTKVNFENFYQELLNDKDSIPTKHPNFAEKNGQIPYFVFDRKNFRQILKEELPIATLSGLPFQFTNGIMTPLTKVNVKILKIGAPPELISKLDKIIKKI